MIKITFAIVCILGKLKQGIEVLWEILKTITENPSMITKLCKT